ncbi:MAG: von Willebrand factor type A domain-containing protein [Verrucomicrobiota bacterium]|nr:von Willebrand factor type A domain-containing protein [Verrucomicrobiota bacterium]
MNPEFTPLTPEEREAWEIRIVSTLFGEADATELKAVADAITRHPELADFRSQMQQTAGLLREATKLDAEAEPKLATARRDAVLRRLSAKPPLLMAPRKSSMKFQFNWVHAVAACFLVALLGAMAIPSFQKVRMMAYESSHFGMENGMVPQEVNAESNRNRMAREEATAPHSTTKEESFQKSQAAFKDQLMREAESLKMQYATRSDTTGSSYGGNISAVNELTDSDVVYEAAPPAPDSVRYTVPAASYKNAMRSTVGYTPPAKLDIAGLSSTTGSAFPAAHPSAATPAPAGPPPLAKEKKSAIEFPEPSSPKDSLVKAPPPRRQAARKEVGMMTGKAMETGSRAYGSNRGTVADIESSSDVKAEQPYGLKMNAQGVDLKEEAPVQNSVVGDDSVVGSRDKVSGSAAGMGIRMRETPFSVGIVLDDAMLQDTGSDTLSATSTSSPHLGGFMEARTNASPTAVHATGVSATAPTGFAGDGGYTEEDVVELGPWEVAADYTANNEPSPPPHLGGFLTTTESVAPNDSPNSSTRGGTPPMYGVSYDIISRLPPIYAEYSAADANATPSADLKLNLWDGLFTEVKPDAANDLSLTADAGISDSVSPETDDPEVSAKPARVLEPLSEIAVVDQPLSTFSLNVSDVSFRLAAEALRRGTWPQADALRTEEFINAVNYHDPLPPEGTPIGFNWEIARWPFSHDRALMRLSVQAGAQGRDSARALNIVVAMDQSGSMARPDRQTVMTAAIRALIEQLHPADRLSIVTFNRTANLVVDNKPPKADTLTRLVETLNPVGGTNLEAGLALAYDTAARHYKASANNRVILFTDGAANLGTLLPESLQEQVESMRKRGIALDCFGIGLDGYNDTMLETLSRHGDGRYGFLQQASDVESQFTKRLLGALQVSAQDLKVQVEWNPRRVQLYRQVGYKLHQLKAEDFRNNAIDAAELGAAEAGTAAYFVQLLREGYGPIGTVRVRYRVPGTDTYEEKAWPMLYAPTMDLTDAAPSLRLLGGTVAFAEWLSSNPYASGYSTNESKRILETLPPAWLSQDPALRTLLEMHQAVQRQGAR